MSWVAPVKSPRALLQGWPIPAALGCHRPRGAGLGAHHVPCWDIPAREDSHLVWKEQERESWGKVDLGKKGQPGVLAKGRAGTGEGRTSLQAQLAVGDRLLEEKQRKGRSGLRRKCDPGKRGERRDNGQETQVIKGTVGSGSEGEGRGKHEKRAVRKKMAARKRQSNNQHK